MAPGRSSSSFPELTFVGFVNRNTRSIGRLEEALDGCLAAAAGGGEGLAHAI